VTARPLLLVGAGGLARETLAACRATNAAHNAPVWNVLGMLDDNPERHGEIVDGVPVLGPAEAVHEYRSAQVVLCTASSRNQTSRRTIARRLGIETERYGTVVHPMASVAPGVEVGSGSILLAFTAITAPQRIGGHVVLMPHCTVTHDDQVSDYVTFASRVALAGNVTVGEATYLGSGCLVREGLTIGEHAVIGMGSVVLDNVPAYEVWVGNPARRLRVLQQSKDFTRMSS